MANFNSAGADAATDYSEQFRQLIANDPDIQRVIQGVWGNTPLNQRPSDTPDHLEKANDAASKQISQILKAKGIQLPDRTFVNPRTGALEGHRGWSGLSGLQKALAVGALGAGGLGAAGALGAFGGLGAAGGAGASGGIGSSIAGIGAPVTLGTGATTGGSMFGLGSIMGGLKNLGGSFLKQFLTGNALDAAGRGLGAIGQTQAHNRGVQLDAMMAGDEMKMANERERRAAETDLMKKMQVAEYLKGGGANFAEPMSVSGKPLGKFDFGVRPATETEMQMATELEGQLMNRLKNPMQLNDYNSKMEPGKVESAMNWLGPLLSTGGAMMGAGRYERPTAQTQTPQAPPTPEAPYTASVANAAGGGGNPWTNIRFR